MANRVTVTNGKLDRNQTRAVASLNAAAEKIAQLEKMLDQAKRARDKAMGRASEHGLNNAEIGRLVGMSKARVWQVLNEYVPGAEGDE